jgi:hypothetical protein
VAVDFDGDVEHGDTAEGCSCFVSSCIAWQGMA